MTACDLPTEFSTVARCQHLRGCFINSKWDRIERFFKTYDKHRWRFGTLDEFLTFYNKERPHMSLDWDNLETPAGAFDRLVPSPADDPDDPLATDE